jgi:peptide/nickel transport system ATP-binding protein
MTDPRPGPHEQLRAGEAVATIEDLHVVYRTSGRELHAVRGVQLVVRPGEIVALVGESGSGKTSIAMALLGLLRDGSTRVELRGTVDVLGVNLLTAPGVDVRALRRERLGAVFQDPMTSLNPTMPVGRQIMEIAGSREEAVRLLAAVGIGDGEERLRAFPHELSGGQRQRVMIAMAIAREPALVVADEPTTSLDVTVQAQILALVRHLRATVGCAFVLVTHDLGVAAQVADRIVVCYAGRVLETGEAERVLRRPAHPYTAELLESRLTLDADRGTLLPTIPGEPPNPRRWPVGCAFEPRCAHRRPACMEALPEEAPLAEGGTSACIRIDELRAELRGSRSGGAWPTTERAAAPAAMVRMTGVTRSFQVRSGAWRRAPLHALRGVDLEVAAGEAIAVVGESGSGKSTLLRLIAGLLTPDAGEIALHPDARPQMVFQDAGASLTPWLTCGDQIGEPIRARVAGRQEARQRVERALEIVGLAPDVARQRPGQLSGGQRQRVALARAIAVPPGLLLCDEPTSSLDVSLAATVLNLLGTLRRELGMALVFVTHDLAAARFVADRIAVMNAGEIVEIGQAEELVRRPSHPYTRTLLAAVPEVGAVPGARSAG